MTDYETTLLAILSERKRASGLDALLTKGTVASTIVNRLFEHAQVNSHKQAVEAESVFHWSMTAKPPSGTAHSPWQSQRFSSPKDVVNKWGESSTTSGQPLPGTK